ncbi:hypothetical protein RQP46_005134 [Phenoliferia psychrophenolica]
MVPTITLSDDERDVKPLLDRHAKPETELLSTPSTLKRTPSKSVVAPSYAERKKARVEKSEVELKRENVDVKSAPGGGAHSSDGPSSSSPAINLDSDDDESEEEALAAQSLEKRVVPPPRWRGRQVYWDHQVKTILKTDAKAIYKLSDAYFNSLDYQTGKSWHSRRVWFAYSESEVQQAAYDQRGGREYFEAYLQRLHAIKVTKERNKTERGERGRTVSPLDKTQPPFVEVPYFEEGTPDDWIDRTTGR